MIHFMVTVSLWTKPDFNKPTHLKLKQPLWLPHNQPQSLNNLTDWGMYTEESWTVLYTWFPWFEMRFMLNSARTLSAQSFILIFITTDPISLNDKSVILRRKPSNKSLQVDFLTMVLSNFFSSFSKISNWTTCVNDSLLLPFLNLLTA